MGGGKVKKRCTDCDKVVEVREKDTQCRSCGKENTLEKETVRQTPTTRKPDDGDQSQKWCSKCNDWVRVPMKTNQCTNCKMFNCLWDTKIKSSKMWCRECNKEVVLPPGAHSNTCTHCNKRALQSHPLDNPQEASRTSMASQVPQKPAPTHVELSSPRMQPVDPMKMRTQEDCAIVHFHAFLPKKIWLCDEYSVVRIRFGIQCFNIWHDELGDFGSEGTFQVGEEVYEKMGCQIAIPRVALQNSVPYKYTVYSRRATVLQDPYEYLHFGPARQLLYNRAVNMKSICQSEHYGVYHQYDDVIYPTVPDWSVIGYLKKTFGFDPPKVEPLNLKAMRQLSLEMHLDLPGKLANNENLPQDFRIDVASRKFRCIYTALESRTVLRHSSGYASTQDVPDIQCVVANWIDSIIQELAKTDNKDKRFIFAFTMVYLIQELRFRYSSPLQELKDQTLLLLLNMIKLEVNISEKQCPGYEMLVSVLPSDKWTHAGDALMKLCTYVAKRRWEHYSFCFQAIPYYHFLKGTCEPFPDTPSLCLVVNDSAVLDLLKLAPTTSNKKQSSDFVRIFQDFYKNNVFDADPELLPLFLRICPQECYHKLVSHLRVHVAFPWLAQVVMELQSKLIPGVLEALIKKVMSEDQKDHELVLSDYAIVLGACLRITEKVLKELNDFEVVKSAVQLFFQVASRSGATDPDASQKRVECIKKLQISVKTWIQRPDVIGGLSFGGNGKISKEVKVWEMLATVGEDEEVSLGGSDLRKQWLMSLKYVILTRVSKLPPEKQFLLFTQTRDDQSVLDDATTESVIVAIEDMTKDKCVTDAVRALWKRATTRKGSSSLGKVMNKLFEKEHGTEVISSSVSDLLAWKLWPWFLDVFTKRSPEMKGLAQPCHQSCKQAIEKIEEACSNVERGNITKKDLELILNNKEGFITLVSAALREQVTLEELTRSIEQRKWQLDEFIKRKEQLRDMLNHISVKVEGYSEIEVELQSDPEATSTVQQLCGVSNDSSGKQQFTINFFSGANPLFPITDNFQTMTLERGSDIFLKHWRNHLNAAAARKKGQLTFSEVVEQAWRPSFQECATLLDQLRNRTIPMEDVDIYFGQHDRADIVLMLKALTLSIHRCHSQTPSLDAAESWARSVADIMHKHWTVRKHGNAAATFLQLKTQLELGGNFQAVESLQSVVSGSQKSCTLGDVTGDVVQAGYSLQVVVGNDARLACLSTIVKHPQILDWIRKVCEDVSDLQNFVAVALATAAGGEDALTRNRLSDLGTVGTGFASLIFMDRSAGFEQLVNACNAVWEVLDHNKTLPELLKACNSQLGWYKTVKETHGSVEATSFGQMSNIRRCGRYIVGCSEPVTCRSLNEVIQVELTDSETDKPLPKKHYSLEELQDLESRLVLITGSEAPQRQEVDDYLEILRLVRQIAEALLELQQSGKVKYIGWKMSFSYIDGECNKDTLQTKAQKMELELDRWREEVDTARKQFYPLNYYTMKQLLKLREELGKLKSDGNPCALTSYALTLLQSISAEVSMDLILKATENLSCPRSSFSDIGSSGPQNFENWRAPVDSDSHVDDEVLSTASTYVSLALTSPISEDDEQKLSKSQQEMYAELVSYLGYDEELAKEAVTVCDDLESAKQWCDENEDTFEVNDQQETTSVGDASMEPHNTVLEEPQTVDLLSANELTNESTSGKPSVMTLLRLESFEVDRRYFDITESLDEKEVYLPLTELGSVLSFLAETLPHGNVPSQRPFRSQTGLRIGHPNLIVTNSDMVHRMVLSLYMQDPSLPLPTPEEVLVCNEKTTTEEVTLLWKRALADPGFRRIFCLVHAENLRYSVGDIAIQSLLVLSKGVKGFRIVILCSSEDEARSHIISKLHLYRREYSPLHTVERYKSYLENHFNSSRLAHSETQVLASQVDQDSSYVRIVYSERAGMGKSLVIRRMTEKLRSIKSTGEFIATIPIHGPDVSPDAIMNTLSNHLDNPFSMIMHFDISPSVFGEVTNILFCLTILRGITDSQGRVWRAHPSQLLAVEITTPARQEMQRDTVGSSAFDLIKLLPKVKCISPRQVLKSIIEGKDDDPDHVLLDINEFQTPAYQRVYQYLKRHYRSQSLDDFTYEGDLEDQPEDCLTILCRYCGMKNPSWSEIRHFVQFLNIQLHSCETSVFLKRTVPKLKTFVVKFLVRMSTDFATSSLSGEVALEENKDSGDKDQIDQLQIVPRNQWEQRPHPYIFFNKDRVSATFVGFTVTEEGDLWDPRNSTLLESGIVPVDLLDTMKKLKFNENYQEWNKEELLSKLAVFMGFSDSDCHNPDTTYVLTVDNLIKILGIQMRFRCGIPVVIMGETGCGKTRLIRFMCDLAARRAPDDMGESKNLLILKVHGGTTEATIVEYVKKAVKKAEQNEKEGRRLETVLFFDEANTTEAIGLIKEVMCDRRFQGQPISSNIRFIAACNPYRKHDPEMIKKLECAGLGFYVKHTDKQQRLGKIPLRQLVYRVLDLPPSMRPLVYDFGRLSDETESQYTEQIVKNHVQKMSDQQKDRIIHSITKVLAWSQQYMGRRKDECGFVSLRDVERAMIVFEYFYLHMDKNFQPLVEEKAEAEGKICCDSLTRSLILALGVCYHARLQERKQYEEGVTQQFKDPLVLQGVDEEDYSTAFRNELRWCQEVLLDRMKLGDNIAKNAALRENVFMMTICIELRIPLFLVGKPGSSKSLAKTIVSASLQGRATTDKFLKKFKQVQMFSYQCSKYSTPESIVDQFKLAKAFQDKQDTKEYVSVVVLDEVGLAEDSPMLPLKALHPLLEDGTEGGDNAQQIIERSERVAFIGISNWALDPAKMNRGVMVTRGDPDTRELVFSASGICSNKPDDPVQGRLQPIFRHLAASYVEICSEVNKKREFYGLRDFYSLIKMLYWLCAKSGMEPNWPQMKHAIARNFGGSDKVNALDIFSKRIGRKREPTIHEKDNKYINPDSTPLGLIKTALTSDAAEGWENRYLLFLTENYVALQTLQHFLQRSPESEVLPDQERWKPFILFGSSFPKDREYTQTCRNINQIKLCMETGRTVILLNLENLYESLYDVLNQYYLSHGGKRYVDLGLQAHRVKCQVHQDFRLILIAESKTVYDKFPTPLINRLEKHFVLSKTLLNDWQQEALKEFMEWIEDFTSCTGQQRETFKPQDTFVGYQPDTPAAVILEASRSLKETDSASTELMKDKVISESKRLVLRTASPDAIIRLKSTRVQQDEAEQLFTMYFHQEHLSSVEEFLNFHLNRTESEHGLLMQLTTHSRLLSPLEIEQLQANLEFSEGRVQQLSLQQFQTEQDFIDKINTAFEAKGGQSLLVIQCDSGHLNGDLIACARYRVSDVRARVSQHQTHVLFIVHLPRKTPGSSFVGFQGNPWICAHMEDLHAGGEYLSLDTALKLSISDLFYNQKLILSDDSNACTASASRHLSYLPQCQRLHGCIHAAASRVHDSEKDRLRTTKRIELLKELIPEELCFPLDSKEFHCVLIEHILQVLQQRDSEQTEDKGWVLAEALNPKHLQCGGTFMNVLTLKIDEILSPIFAEILALIDFNYNLNLLLEQVPLRIFWVSMFKDVCHFEYKDIGAHPREQVPGVGGHLSENLFKCQLPFSWIIKDRVAAEWRFYQSAVGDNDDKLHDKLYTLLSAEPIGKVMMLVDPDHVEEFAERYLHDFVRSMHVCKHKSLGFADMEYKIICRAVKGFSLSAAFCHQDSLLSMIVTLHICYEKMKDQIFWFGELTAYIPGILLRLIREVPDCSPDVVLHLHAAKAALNSDELDISRPLKSLKMDKLIKDLRWWLKKVYKSQAAIDAILSMPSQHTLAQSARKRWSFLNAMQKFVEHVLLREERLVIFARRLEMSLQNDSDLMKATTYKELQNLLVRLDKALVSKFKLRGQKQQSIRESCAFFLMEVMSSICLGGDSVPEDCVIDSLIELAFPLDEGCAKPAAGKLTFIHAAVPGFHLFVLRLLLQYKMDQVRCHLESYMQKYAEHCTKQKMSKTEMFLQFIQCYEDCLSRRLSVCSQDSQIAEVTEVLTDGYKTCDDQTPTNADDVTVNFLIGIGKIRFSLVFAADLLSGLTSESIDSTTEKFLEEVKNLSLNIGPAEGFLLRNLVRWNGYSRLMDLALSDEHSLRSTVPANLMVEDDKLIDPFVIYNPQYAELRDCVADAVCFQSFSNLNDVTKDLKVEDAVPLLLVLYEKLTLAAATSRTSAQWREQVQRPFLKFIEESETITQDQQLRSIAESLVKNSLGAPLTVKPEQDPLHRILTVIVLHFTSVIYCKQKHEILRLFYGLMQIPKSMKDLYIPTMPEKTVGSAQSEFGVKFYECPKGHRFHANHESMKSVPSRVRQKSETLSCYVCGSKVDVAQYVGRELMASPRQGYVLGSPTNRSGTPDPERNLSAASSVIIRILMHSALLWASSSDQDLYIPVAQFMNLDHKNCSVTDVCLEHLKCDLHLLSKVIGRCIDEAALTVHIILQEILQKPPPRGVTEGVGRLHTPEARDKWEDTFDAEYIQPTLEDLAMKLHRAIMSNDKKEHNELFAIVYGKTAQPAEEGDLPNLWLYRPRMTLDYLPQLLPYKEISAKHPMLHIFLRMEPSLRATKHIPQLQQLQHRLYDRFHHRVDAQQAAKLTLGEFLNTMSQENEYQWKLYQDLFSCLKVAWKLVREKLPDYAKSYLLMEEEDLVPAIDDNTPLEYLIPTAEGRGACTTALMKYLVLIHNHFIQSCREIAEKQPESKTPWMERFILLSRVQRCHLLDYEQELVPLVVSHCHYTGAATHGHINCNLPALEKHILDKFIHGKPLISLELPQVAYRRKERDIYTATTLVAVRKNVPQKELPLHVQLGILKELNEVHHLSQTLDGVNIILGFLASGGGKPGLRLQEYRRKTLKMEHHPFSKKAEEHCNLEHIISLWRTLSVELAKKHTRADQEPFEHIPEKLQKDFVPENIFQGALDDMKQCAPEKRFRKALANLDEDQLVETLYEFIETSVKHTRKDDRDKSLVEAIEGYITQNDLPPIQRLREEFEGFEVTLGHAVALWKYIVRPPEYEDTIDKD